MEGLKTNNTLSVLGNTHVYKHIYSLLIVKASKHKADLAFLCSSTASNESTGATVKM